MKSLSYSIQIKKPRDFVYRQMTNKAVYPGWAKAWGEGMTYEGRWVAGEHLAFIDQSKTGTKVIIDKIVPGEAIEMTHVEMVNPQDCAIQDQEEMMQNWIGSKENYYFKADDANTTTVEVVTVTDAAFEPMMEAWHEALRLFKEICESSHDEEQ